MVGGFPSPLRDLTLNLREVQRLADIHTQLTGEKRGRRHDVDVLNKSGIVLIVACWESFVEDAAKAGFFWMLAKASDPNPIPGKVLSLAGASIRGDPDPRRVFALAGEGWRATLRDHATATLSAFIDGFNTPRAMKVDRLFEDLLGLKGVSTQWRWHKNSNSRVVKRLDELITLRGQIAHRVSVDRYVKKAEVMQAAELVTNMAIITSNRIRAHLDSCIGEPPWGQMQVGSAQ